MCRGVQISSLWSWSTGLSIRHAVPCTYNAPL